MTKLLPSLLVLLLAGCIAPSHAATDPPQDPQGPQPAPAAAEQTWEWDGSLTGAGATLPNGDTEFVGVLTLPDRFTVEENRTSLTVAMTWTAVGPQPLYLAVFDREGRHIVESAFPYDGSVGVTFQAADPLPGKWSAIGMVNGVAADAQYHIRVTVR
jgi:hypothetical protein